MRGRRRAEWDHDLVEKWHIDDRDPDKHDEYRVDLARDCRSGKVFIVETLFSCWEQVIDGTPPRVTKYELEEYLKRYPCYRGIVAYTLATNPFPSKWDKVVYSDGLFPGVPLNKMPAWMQSRI